MWFCVRDLCEKLLLAIKKIATDPGQDQDQVVVSEVVLIIAPGSRVRI